MIVNAISSEQGHSVINQCDSCGGDHEVILKPANAALQKQGFTHWFECPHRAQGGPVMVIYEEPKKAEPIELSMPIEPVAEAEVAVEEVAQPDDSTV